MRRLSLSLLSALALATTTASPAAASDGYKSYMDCVKFAATWCEETRKTVENFLEGWAVEAGCALLDVRCLVFWI